MSDKPSDTIKARLPRGFADRGEAEIAATEAMLAEIKAVYTLYGFEGVETPFIEYTDALGKFCPIRTARTKVCFRSRMMTSNGCRCATI